MIEVDSLCKSFTATPTSTGIGGALKSLFSKGSRKVEAVSNLTFQINKGERIAFVGPNGAGKSTTIKMLTGILYPTSGNIRVMGMCPWEERSRLGYHIGTVFGQRSQLWQHLPPSDTFELLAAIYEIKPSEYQHQLARLVKLFEIKELLSQPVKQLSLGERMRCELVASLLHRPAVLFLDEPTIGLDINAKLTIRSLLNRLSEDFETTLFLTSHDTADIEQVAERVIVLNEGEIVTDSSVKELKKTYFKRKILKFIMDSEELIPPLHGVEILQNGEYHFVCRIDTDSIPIDQVIKEALDRTNLKDVTIEDPSMEEVIRLLYQRKRHDPR